MNKTNQEAIETVEQQPAVEQPQQQNSTNNEQEKKTTIEELTTQFHKAQLNGHSSQNGSQEQQRNPKKMLKPEFVQCRNYKYMDEIIKTIPHIQSLKDVPIDKYLESVDAQCFIIRSNNDDDIHKAIKYAVWTSIPPNNVTLNKAYEEAQEKKSEIFLFYSVVKSGQFVGVARLASEFLEETFPYWWQPNKWRGHFKIEWLYVKDVTYQSFENLKNANDMPVIRSKDCTKVDWAQSGQKMLEIFKNASSEPNIFNDFAHMDQREQYVRYTRSFNYNNYPNYYGNYMPMNQNYYGFNPQMMYGYYPQNGYFYPPQGMQNIYPPQQNPYGGQQNRQMNQQYSQNYYQQYQGGQQNQQQGQQGQQGQQAQQAQQGQQGQQAQQGQQGQQGQQAQGGNYQNPQMYQQKPQNEKKINMQQQQQQGQAENEEKKYQNQN